LRFKFSVQLEMVLILGGRIGMFFTGVPIKIMHGCG